MRNILIPFGMETHFCLYFFAGFFNTIVWNGCPEVNNLNDSSPRVKSAYFIDIFLSISKQRCFL